ncbi:MAG: hypothetical protein J07HX5_00130 [halophilic archaeon J07HX5]|nr:MAG: hypothetical protein J07HX5_00130 [halophilic archaeon J07HX5]
MAVTVGRLTANVSCGRVSACGGESDRKQRDLRAFHPVHRTVCQHPAAEAVCLSVASRVSHATVKRPAPGPCDRRMFLTTAQKGRETQTERAEKFDLLLGDEPPRLTLIEAMPTPKHILYAEQAQDHGVNAADTRYHSVIRCIGNGLAEFPTHTLNYQQLSCRTRSGWNRAVPNGLRKRSTR